MRANVETPVTSIPEWRQKLRDKAKTTGPSFLHMHAQLPSVGRTNIVLGATPTMSVVLKTYATGGENEIHAHPHEDHVFVVLQGGAEFYGPNNETKLVKQNDCVLMPKGTLYRFQATEGEPLVMLRVGAIPDDSFDPLERVDAGGAPFSGFSAENKEVAPVLSDKWFE